VTGCILSTIFTDESEVKSRECVKSKHQKMTGLAASKRIMSPGVGLASFTSESLCEWRTNTLASDWVTDMSRPLTLWTFCSQTTKHNNMHWQLLH